MRTATSRFPRLHRRERLQGSTPGWGRIFLWALAVIALASAFGCATIPRETSEDWTVLLPADCAAYFSLNLSARNRGIVGEIAGELAYPRQRHSDVQAYPRQRHSDVQAYPRQAPSGFDWIAALDRTDRLYGACKVTLDTSPVFYVAAGGRFPAAVIRYGLSHSDEWRSVELPRASRLPRRGARSDGIYWINRSVPLQVYLTKDSALLVSTDDIRPMIELYRRGLHRTASRSSYSGNTLPSLLPSTVLQEMDTSDMVVYFPLLGGNPLLGPAGASLPAGEAWIVARRNGEGPNGDQKGSSSDQEGSNSDQEGFAIQGHFVLLDETVGEGFTRVLKLLLLYLLKKGEVEDFSKRLRKLEFVQRGTLVRVSGLTLSSDDLVRLVRGVLAGDTGSL